MYTILRHIKCVKMCKIACALCAMRYFRKCVFSRRLPCYFEPFFNFLALFLPLHLLLTLLSLIIIILAFLKEILNLLHTRIILLLSLLYNIQNSILRFFELSVLACHFVGCLHLYTFAVVFLLLRDLVRRLL